MKKILSFVLLAVLALSLTACGEKKPAEANYTFGMGVVSNADSSKENHAQMDSTVAAVVLDAEGKIVALRLDAMQNKMDVTGGAVDVNGSWNTKMELGDAYGMVAYGAAIAEWDAQALAFETWAVGKTIDEIKNMELTTNDHGYSVAVDADLYAGCTIDLTDFIEATVKAGTDAWAVAFTTADAFTVGVAVISASNESVAATAEADAQVKMYSEYGAAVVGADGKVLAALHDMIQPVINVSLDGAITGANVKPTKRELGADYGMVAYGAAIAEWDAQAAAFTNYCVGKTAAEIKAIELKTNDHGYQVPADETLYAACTMQVTGAMAVVAKAAEIAR